MNKIINFEGAIQDGLVNVISGRSSGEDFAKKSRVVEWLKAGYDIVIVIDGDKIKAISDSFIKGFYGFIFDELKSKKIIKSKVTLDTDEYYNMLIEKNLIILDEIYRDKIN